MRNKSTYFQLSGCDMCVAKEVVNRAGKEIVNKEIVMTKESKE